MTALRAFWGRHSGRIAVGCLIVLCAVVGLWLWSTRGDAGAVDRFAFRSTALPAEYAYLDRERVGSYFAQIRGGESRSEQQSVLTARSGKLVVNSGTAIEGGIEARTERTVNRIVTATDAANFLALRDALDDPDLQDPVRLRVLDANQRRKRFAASVVEIHEGDFVLIRNAQVQIPAYAQPYDAIKRFGSVAVETARLANPGSPAADKAAERRAGLAAVAYARRRIGPAPRVVLNLGSRWASDEPTFGRTVDGKPVPGCPANRRLWPKFGNVWPEAPQPNARILVPIQYALLSPEPSLISGGRSTILGKAVRVLTPPEKPRVRPRVHDVCYRDVGTYSLFGLQERFLPEGVLRRLRGVTRERIRRSLASDTAVIAPAAVVLPIAIYK